MAGAQKKSFTVRDLPDSERPRERMKRYGTEVLSGQEIIALILGRGVSGESVMVTASRLLSTFGSLSGVGEASLEELCQVRGIGLAKAAQIKAAFELARRHETSSPTMKKTGVESPEEAVKLVREYFQGKKKEHFCIISLDNRNRAIRTSPVSIGSLNASIAHPREIFREAISSLAAGIILVHNHPSGDPEPSREDVELTRQLVRAGELVGIGVLDHLIIGDNNWVSLKQKGMM